jgi:superfamily I DNA/RNA helicase
MAKSLKDLPEGAGSLSHEDLRKLDTHCNKVVADFETDVKTAAGEVIKTLSDHGTNPESTSRGWLKAIYKYQDPEGRIYKPTPAFLSNAADSSKWYSKANDKLRLEMEGSLEGPLEQFTRLFDKPYKAYVTALTICGQIYGLGVADALRTAFEEVQKEKNVISIDDSNTILRGIIDGTDTPFIYEKLGVRFDDFLLDEFQDTSEIQWDNFLPLLKNSESIDGHSLVVGDVKQSIYRWRGSDWNLLGKRVQEQFPTASTKVLDGNYRTCREIVEFNNGFFAFAAEKLGVSSIYADVRQQVRTRSSAPGMVEAVFTDDELAQVVASVRELQGRGVQWKDIAVLVRNNADGAAVAEAFVEENIPVVSDDSLYVKASVTVRRLVSQMSLADTPSSEDNPTAAGFLAAEMGIAVPDHYHSLMDLAEGLLRDLRDADRTTFEAEIPYIESFMDYLRDWMSTGGNNLSAFLKAWEEAEPKISSPSSGNSVRVMTVHKSKGLEFPFVIFPFAEKVTLYKASSYWCRPRVHGTALEGRAEGFYHVSLDKGAADSLFADSLEEERKLQAVDNINIFYVALTRAVYGLKIISAMPPAKFTDALAKGAEPEWQNLSQILYSYVGGSEFCKGEPYTPVQKEEKSEGTVLLEYPSFPADSGGRLSFSPEAADYFGEDGTFGPEASIRIRGNVLHDILSSVVVPEDIPGAVKSAVMDGSLPAALQSETVKLLQGRIASVQDRGWFAPDAKVFREVSIIDVDGREWRPDRVVLHPDGRVSIIDYKFGAPEAKYARQVGRYADLYRRMGCSDVRGYIWYLGDNSIQ